MPYPLKFTHPPKQTTAPGKTSQLQQRKTSIYRFKRLNDSGMPPFTKRVASHKMQKRFQRRAVCFRDPCDRGAVRRVASHVVTFPLLICSRALHKKHLMLTALQFFTSDCETPWRVATNVGVFQSYYKYSCRRFFLYSL